LYQIPAFGAFDDFSGFLESVSGETSKTCQVRGLNLPWVYKFHPQNPTARRTFAVATRYRGGHAEGSCFRRFGAAGSAILQSRAGSFS
jgi:hypothetical protein